MNKNEWILHCFYTEFKNGFRNFQLLTNIMWITSDFQLIYRHNKGIKVEIIYRTPKMHLLIIYACISSLIHSPNTIFYWTKFKIWAPTNIPFFILTLLTLGNFMQSNQLRFRSITLKTFTKPSLIWSDGKKPFSMLTTGWLVTFFCPEIRAYWSGHYFFE
jgi:hypothetical protein